ncbi:MAG: hypothetical protein JXP34_10205 [Planctomycetes bacterium]|nr:hypothetical protein [Planctomycetota bacterium]
MEARNRAIPRAAMLLCGAVILAAAPAVWAQPFRVGGHVDVVIGGGPGHQTREWVPGHYETRYERQVIPGGYQRVWVPPAYQTVRGPFRSHQRIVTPGHYRLQWVPERIVTVERRVWVPGYYRVVQHRRPGPVVRIGGILRF